VLVTPYVVGTATLNAGATFEARSRALVPHVLTVKARFRPKAKTVLVTGRLSALGKPRTGVKVSIIGGSPKGATFWEGSARTRSDGSYSLRKRVRLQLRARKLVVFAYINLGHAPCVDPTAAPGGCVDENISPPASRTVYLRIPRLRKH
jgi:hypothetical protein